MVTAAPSWERERERRRRRASLSSSAAATMSIQDSGQVSDFSSDEKAAIRTIWKNVYEKYEDAGVAILSRLFVSHPGVKEFFPKFRELRTTESMRKSPALRWHGERIINAINDAVEELDVPAMQRLRLRQLSQRHATEFNVEPQFFKEDLNRRGPTRRCTAVHAGTSTTALC
uniref:Globin-1-like isoform X2 n=2 Tax=Petromyzon marinus TaxID=7757 RepID=A0AAJ7U0P0_PETMA|nr:globin-1-like isoform X2 [Petromyzon marinus]